MNSRTAPQDRAPNARSLRVLASVVTLAFVVGVPAFVGCKKSDSATEGAAASASASASAIGSVAAMSGGIPIAASAIASIVNPRGRAPYAGPVGTVVGVVRVTGPEPPERRNYKPPFGCGAALRTYEKIFRKGPGGELGDALVGVTEYEGYVPAKDEAVVLPIKGCAYDRRTVAMTFGQRLEIVNEDTKEPYLPHLEGSRNPALMVAVPHGEPVKIYPPAPVRYQLRDEMSHSWLEAPVFVLRYATHDVTRENGSFRIEGIPAGTVKVSAYHPVLDKAVNKTIDLKPGETATVDLELSYEGERADAPAEPAASASSSGAASAPQVREVH